MTELLNKLNEEQKELEDKIVRLSYFIDNNTTFKHLDLEMQELLESQLYHMRYYNNILLNRIEYIKEKK